MDEVQKSRKIPGYHYAEGLGADVDDPEHRLALAFWADLSDRRGVGDGLEMCDADVQREIFAEWVQMLRDHFDGADNNVGAVARGAREDADITLRFLAAAMGVDPEVLMLFEGGRYPGGPNATMKLAAGYEDHLCVELSRLNGKWRWLHKEGAK